MRLITFEIKDEQRIAAMTSDTEALDLAAASKLFDSSENPDFANMQALIESGDEGLESAQNMLEKQPDESIFSLADIKLLSPLPVPMQLRDFANFELHCLNALESSMRMRAAKEEDPEAAYNQYKESGAYNLIDLWYEQPLYFKCNRFNVIGHDENVIWPSHASIMDYELEYGMDRLEIHRDAVSAGHRVVIVDDLLATGGTMRATVDLIHQLGADVAACLFVVELAFLNGRGQLPGVPVHSLVSYA